MDDSDRFALHRPEFLGALERGEAKITTLLAGSAFEVRAGGTLVEAGTDHRFVYRLQQGWAGRSRTLADGRHQYILIFLPGDLFAVKSMFLSRHPDATTAISDLTIEKIGYRELHQAYVADSDVASRCIWQVMEEERRLHSWVVGLGQGSAEERVAMLLVDFRGRLIASGAIKPDALSYAMPLTHIKLADHLGITPVHVNRVLRNLRSGGVATLRDGVVTINNLSALVNCASALLDVYEQTSPAYVGGKPPRGSRQ